MIRIAFAFFILALSCCAVNAQLGPSAGGLGPSNAPGLPANPNSTTNPTVSNDLTQGYQVGSLWQNATTGQVFIARSVAAGAAVWLQLDTSDFPGYIVGNWYLPSGLDGAPNSGANPGIGSIRLVPGFIKQRATINSLGVRITTLSAAGNVQAAIYANNPVTNRPTGAALASTASISTAATGSLNSAVSIQLDPGMYWFATNCDNATATFSVLSVASLSLSSRIGSVTQANDLQATQSLIGVSTAQTFGTWPDLTAGSFADITAQSAPLVQFKIGSVP